MTSSTNDGSRNTEQKASNSDLGGAVEDHRGTISKSSACLWERLACCNTQNWRHQVGKYIKDCQLMCDTKCSLYGLRRHYGWERVICRPCRCRAWGRCCRWRRLVWVSFHSWCLERLQPDLANLVSYMFHGHARPLAVTGHASKKFFHKRMHQLWNLKFIQLHAT